MDLVLMILILAVTIMYSITQICDVFKELFKQNKEDEESKWWNMILEETQDKEDILILMLIQERDKQIELLETENADLKKLLIEVLQEKKHLEKIVKELKSKRNGGTNE